MKSTNQRNFTSHTKEDCGNIAEHLIWLISRDIHVSVARILLSKGISIIHYHHTVKRLLQTIFLEPWSQLFIHFLSHWLIFSFAVFLAPALRVRDPVTNKRQPLPSWSSRVRTKKSWKMLGEWMSRFFLDVPWLLGYLTRAAMTKEYGLAAYNTIEIWCPKFWRLEAQDQEVNKDWDFPSGPVAKRLWTPSARGPGSILGQGTRSQMGQLRVHMPQLKIPHAELKIKDP